MSLLEIAWVVQLARLGAVLFQPLYGNYFNFYHITPDSNNNKLRTRGAKIMNVKNFFYLPANCSDKLIRNNVTLAGPSSGKLLLMKVFNWARKLMCRCVIGWVMSGNS